MIKLREWARGEGKKCRQRAAMASERAKAGVSHNVVYGIKKENTEAHSTNNLPQKKQQRPTKRRVCVEEEDRAEGKSSEQVPRESHLRGVDGCRGESERLAVWFCECVCVYREVTSVEG